MRHRLSQEVSVIFTRRPSLIVVDNLATALAEVEALLAGADATNRPGLQQAVAALSALLEASRDPEVQWARQILSAAGIDPAAAAVEAVRALRAKAPGLGVLEAGVLAEKSAEPSAAPVS